MNYDCLVCKYQTNDISNWRRHCRSKLHNQKTDAFLTITDHDKNSKKPDHAHDASYPDKKYPDNENLLIKKSTSVSALKIKVSPSTRIKKTEKNVKKTRKSDEDSTNDKSGESTRICKNGDFLGFCENKSIIAFQKVSASTRINELPTPQKTTKSARESKFMCRFCGKKFAHRSGANRHENHRCQLSNTCNKNTQNIPSGNEYFCVDGAEQCVKNVMILKQKDIQLNEKEKQLNYFIQNNAFLQDAYNVATATVDKTFDMINNLTVALTYLTSHLKKIPTLKKLTHDNTIKLLPYEKITTAYFSNNSTFI